MKTLLASAVGAHDPMAVLLAAGINPCSLEDYGAQRKRHLASLVASIRPAAAEEIAPEPDQLPQPPPAPREIKDDPLLAWGDLPTPKEQVQIKQVKAALSQVEIFVLNPEEYTAALTAAAWADIPRPTRQLLEALGLSKAEIEKLPGSVLREIGEGPPTVLLRSMRTGKYSLRDARTRISTGLERAVTTLQNNAVREMVTDFRASSAKSAQDRLGPRYQEVVERYVSQPVSDPPAAIQDKNLARWRRLLRDGLGDELPAHLEFNVLEDIKARGLPVPKGEELARIIRGAVRDTLRDTDDLLQTIHRSQYYKAGAGYGGKFISPETVKGAAHTGRVAESIFQRASDRLEQRIIQRGIDRGELQDAKRWVTVGGSSRHAALNGRVVPLNAGFRLGGQVYAGPRDPGMPPEHSSLCRCFLQVKLRYERDPKRSAEENERRLAESKIWR